MHRDRQTQGEDGHVRMEAETEIMIFKPKVAGKHQALEEARKNSSLQVSEVTSPCCHLDF